jgi:hypothetical protein
MMHKSCCYHWGSNRDIDMFYSGRKWICVADQKLLRDCRLFIKLQYKYTYLYSVKFRRSIAK